MQPLGNRGGDSPRLYLIGFVADHAFAFPAESVERILAMAALIPLPETPPTVAGVLNYHGAILPVVDIARAVGLPRTIPRPDQHLVLVAADTRYLLWWDKVDRIVSLPVEAIDTVAAAEARGLTTGVARLGTHTVPILSPRALDPGLVVVHRGSEVA